MQGHLDARADRGRPWRRPRRSPRASPRSAPDRLISSDLRRAGRHRRAWSAPRCGLAVKFDPRLRETHLGQWQGRTVAEIEARVARARSRRGAPTPAGRRPAASRASRWCAARGPSWTSSTRSSPTPNPEGTSGGGPRRHDRRAGVRPARPAHRRRGRRSAAWPTASGPCSRAAPTTRAGGCRATTSEPEPAPRLSTGGMASVSTCPWPS